MSEIDPHLPPPPFTTHWALFLDVDGTLLEHAPQPQEVRVSPRLMVLLRALSHAPGAAIALISGRSVEDLDQLFAPLQLPAAGQHGAERRSADGTMHRQPLTLEEKLATAEPFVARLVERHAGLVAENKGLSLALHYRRAPELKPVVEREMHALARGLDDGFEILEGKYVIEIKPSGRDKGTAIAEFMAEEPFVGRTPAFLGDDISDEYGFTLVNANGGHSVKVGTGPSVARWRLSNASAVHHWLGAALRFSGRRQSEEAR
jgi:trehalose 6-phosphate phosphatase